MKIIFLFLLSISISLVHAQDCKKLQLGTYRISGDDTNPESILIRTSAYQFEEVKSLGLKLQFNIRWTSDCTYELSNPKVLKGELPSIKDDQVVYVKIKKVAATYYTAEISSNFNDLVLERNIDILED